MFSIENHGFERSNETRGQNSLVDRMEQDLLLNSQYEPLKNEQLLRSKTIYVIVY